MFIPELYRARVRHRPVYKRYRDEGFASEVAAPHHTSCLYQNYTGQGGATILYKRYRDEAVASEATRWASQNGGRFPIWKLQKQTLHLYTVCIPAGGAPPAGKVAGHTMCGGTSEANPSSLYRLYTGRWRPLARYSSGINTMRGVASGPTYLPHHTTCLYQNYTGPGGATRGYTNGTNIKGLLGGKPKWWRPTCHTTHGVYIRTIPGQGALCAGTQRTDMNGLLLKLPDGQPDGKQKCWHRHLPHHTSCLYRKYTGQGGAAGRYTNGTDINSLLDGKPKWWRPTCHTTRRDHTSCLYQNYTGQGGAPCG